MGQSRVHGMRGERTPCAGVCISHPLLCTTSGQAVKAAIDTLANEDEAIAIDRRSRVPVRYLRKLCGKEA